MVELSGAAMGSTKRKMLAAERAEFGHFVATLTPEQWATPSLCAGWTVRDVVVHVIGPPDVSTLLRRTPGRVSISGGRSIGPTRIAWPNAPGCPGSRCWRHMKRRSGLNIPTFRC
jgi:hypothetical protein